MNKPLIIAHRGLRHEAPENTLPAIQAALELQHISGIEFDTELTADGELVVIHQETVAPDRAFSRVSTEYRDLVRDWVRERTVADIQTLDAGSWMGPEFSHIHVPTLQQVMQLSWGSTLPYIELKDATYWRDIRDEYRPAEVVAAALRVLQSIQLPFAVISFNPKILQLLTSHLPNVPTTLALWTEWRGKPKAAIALAQSCGAETISLPDSIVVEDPTWVSHCHSAMISIHVYPVSPARDEPNFNLWTAVSQHSTWDALCALGVDAILSDFARETVAHFTKSA